MMNLELMILILVVAFVVSQVFWMRNVQKLVDKSMSRSFGEYVQAENFKVLSKESKKNKSASEVEDGYATEQAERANRAFGLL